MAEAMSFPAFVVGLVVAWFTLASMVGTFVVPRYVTSRITYVTMGAVRRGFRVATRFIPGYEEKDRLLSYMAPVALLVLIGVWLVLLLFSYALMLLPFEGGDLGNALRVSGSSMLTLGFAAPKAGGSTVIVFAAAATGLVVVALLIGYLPMIYAAFNRRETLVTMLESRAGEPAWGPELLTREAFIGGLDTLPALYRDWELWAADLAETHTTHPWLVAFRSPHPLRSWITSMLAVLDSAALYLALSPDAAPSEAKNCLRMGFVALRGIADAFRFDYDADPLPNAPIQLPYEDFLAGIARMRAGNFPIERTPEEAWVHFRGWRVNYESIVYRLADENIVVPALWSGSRSYIDGTPIPPIRPVQRSPERPEGIEKVEVPDISKWIKQKRKMELAKKKLNEAAVAEEGERQA
jgi:hypothetical protein